MIVTLLPALVNPPGPAVALEAPAVPPAPPRAVRVAATAASSRREVLEDPALTCVPETDTETAGGCAPASGQPRKETTALARTNSTAAPASSDPAVPKPATYARVARTFAIYRQP